MDPIQCEHLVASAAAEERTCPVCLEEIDCARVLDCGHCMCDTCAVRYCRNLLGRKRPTISSLLVVGPVACPKCRDVSLVALDSAKSLVGLPETGKLTALVSVCQGFVNNPSLFLGIEEDVTEDCEEELSDGEGGRITGDGDLEARLQARLQSAGQELSNLRQESRNLRQEIRAQASMAAAETETETENSNEAEAIDSLVRRLSSIFSGPADRLVRRQEAARLRLEAAWLRLRCLQFARSCYGNGFLGNFAEAWRTVASNSAEVKRAADPTAWDDAALQLRRDSFVAWAIAVAKDASKDGALDSEETVTAAVAAAAAAAATDRSGAAGATGTLSPVSAEGQGRIVQTKLLWRVGRGGEGPLEFRWPVHANFVSNDRVAVCDKNNCRVQLLSLKTGEFIQFMGSGCLKPRRILQSQNGKFYVCDENAACVKVFNEQLELVGRLGDGIFHCPSGIAETRNGHIVLSDLDHAFVVVISPDTGEIVRKFHTRLAGDDYIPSPHFVSLDDDDFILVSDSLNNTVKIFDPRGRISGRIRGFKCPRGLAVDHRGNLLVVNADTHSVSLFTSLGKHLQLVLSARDGLNFPMSAAFDKDRHQLLLTQCNVYGQCEVLLYQMEYLDNEVDDVKDAIKDV
ncbi:hypothetical protein BOX15_Mlig032216g5 [Macrostomum lignano]|uniref:RING-type domain-containing protein n=1 Tax=Macrostomum lignano TaxID=282301 RepID=A0A267EQ05_9PLAT|nr:hypothetical protein BOX15_Mlig032216g2 [Macrostomum lignano]PAA83825.1 hypothetical protein BOX15_Mlig032216g5 [Macrostomum lignano]